MKPLTHWKKIVTFITLMFLSVVGVKTSSATTPEATQAETLLSPAETILAQGCPYGGTKLPYARVTTQQRGSLNIRSSPNGRIIGSVPDGWAVITGRRDQGWTYLDYSRYYRYPSYLSAPTLQSGWVSTTYLRELGQFCEKPTAMMRSNLKALFGAKQVLVQEDWVQQGDRIAKGIPQS